MTSATFASLSVPAMEDTMEVSSSPADNNFDDDIDIDFGDYGGGAHATDDERMLEDADPTRPPTATDDMMDDDDFTITAPIVEEVMQDGLDGDSYQLTEHPDEELIDYDDDLFPDDTQLAYDGPAPTENVHVETDLIPHPEDAAVAAADGESNTIAAKPLAENTDDQTVHLESSSRDILTEEKSSVESFIPVEGDVGNVDNAENAENFENAGQHTEAEAVDDAAFGEGEDEEVQESETLKIQPHFPGTISTSLGYSAEGPPTPTDTGLHPMTVIFEGLEMALFKSRAQPDGLLKDDNLVNVSLADLLRNCKERLAIKIGEIVSEDQELILVFDRLGLLLNENSRSASDTSLNEVLKVYLRLHSNDHVEDVSPLCITLSRQPKFTSSLKFLQLAASQGQGISGFPSLAVSNEEFYEDDGEEVYSDEEKGQEVVPAETNFDDFAESGQHPEKQNAGQEYEDAGDSEPQPHSGEFQDDEYHDAQYQDDLEQHGELQGGEYLEGEFGDFDVNEEYPDPEDDDEPQHAEIVGHSHEVVVVNSNTASTSEKASSRPDETIKGLADPESAASSATVKGDVGDVKTGEYSQDDDDYIDWDDDEDLTTIPSDPHTDDGDGDLLGLLADDEVPLPTGDVSKPSTDATHSANIVTEAGEKHFVHSDDHNETSAGNLALEDFSNVELVEYPDDDEQYNDADVDEKHTNEAGDELAQHEESDHTQADNLDYDDQGEPGEEDEQFHTAFDLLEGGDYEHPQKTGDASEPGKEIHGGELNDEDDIGYDDDDAEYETPPVATTGSRNSPLGKRSFQEHADDDELTFDDDEPELKKSRSD